MSPLPNRNRARYGDADGHMVVQRSFESVLENGMPMLVKAGAPTDADFQDPMDGLGAIDSSANRVYFRVGGVWRYAALT